MPCFKLSVFLVIAAFNLFAVNGQTTSQADSKLFDPFCKRSSTRSALRMCSPIAADAEVNYGGTDVYSIAPKGQVEFRGISDQQIRKTYFTINPYGYERINVNCVTVTATGVKSGLVKIYPMSFGDRLLKLPEDASSEGTGLKIAGIYLKGVTVMYSGSIPVTCTWAGTVLGTRLSEKEPSSFNNALRI